MIVLVTALIFLAACADQERTPSSLDLDTPGSEKPTLADGGQTTTETAVDLTPPSLVTPATPTTTEDALNAEAWRIYENDFFGYRFSYPPEARISKQGVTGFPAEELPQNMTTEMYWEQLEATYPDDLCVSVRIKTGFVTFVPASEKGGRYTGPCGITGVGDYALTDISETILIDDQTCIASGSRLFRQSATPSWEGEFYLLPLDDTITVHFGSLG